MIPNRLTLILAGVVATMFLSLAAYFYGVGHGRLEIQAKWDADIAARAEAALEAERQARAREQALLAAKQKVEELYEKSQKRAQADADSARTELDSLRNALAARDREAGANPAAPCKSHGATERRLLGECAARYTGVAKDADRLVLMLNGLQEYVLQVCTRQD